MPFSTDNSWPVGLLKIFEICREVNRPLENHYYGPYDKLINYCFGDSFTFFVAPQRPPDNASKEVIDFIVFLIVFDALRRPVLIAEVKDDSWASNPGLRLEADEQIRRRNNIMLSDCPLGCVTGTVTRPGNVTGFSRVRVRVAEFVPQQNPYPQPRVGGFEHRRIFRFCKHPFAYAALQIVSKHSNLHFHGSTFDLVQICAFRPLMCTTSLQSFVSLRNRLVSIRISSRTHITSLTTPPAKFRRIQTRFADASSSLPAI